MSKDLILLDTNIIIYTLKEDPVISDFINGKRGVVSFVTEIELLGWKNITQQNKATIEMFLDDCMFIEYSIRIKKATIEIKSKYGLKLADAFIAASAIEFDIPLVSADKVFSKVKELNFINIFPTTK
jgi:hypothetical protein